MLGTSGSKLPLLCQSSAPGDSPDNCHCQWTACICQRRICCTPVHPGQLCQHDTCSLSVHRSQAERTTAISTADMSDFPKWSRMQWNMCPPGNRSRWKDRGTTRPMRAGVWRKKGQPPLVVCCLPTLVRQNCGSAPTAHSDRAGRPVARKQGPFP